MAMGKQHCRAQRVHFGSSLHPSLRRQCAKATMQGQRVNFLPAFKAETGKCAKAAARSYTLACKTLAPTREHLLQADWGGFAWDLAASQGRTGPGGVFDHILGGPRPCGPCRIFTAKSFFTSKCLFGLWLPKMRSNAPLGRPDLVLRAGD